MELKYLINTLKLLFCVSVLSLLCGCPRVAYVDLHNNSGVYLDVDFGGLKASIPPDAHEKLRYTSGTFNVKSELGDWSYKRYIPNGGEDSEFFDGTLVVQIETDGKVFAVKKEVSRPVSVSDYKQPKGYPLIPE